MTTHSSQSGGPASYAVGSFRLDTARRQLLNADNQPVALTGKAYELLLHLVERHGELVEKQALVDTLWPNAVVEENNLNQAVSALRVALGDDPKAPQYITTVKGRGYQLIAAVQDLHNSGQATVGQSRGKAWHPAMVVASIAIIGLAIFALLRTGPDPDRADSTQPSPAVASAAILDTFHSARLKLVTDFPGSHSEPTLSPDGTMVAFVSTADGTPQIWVQNLQRGDAIQITEGPHPASAPTWAPDNSQIVYSREGPDGPGLFSVGTLGTPGPKQIAEYGSSPSFAARHDNLVYTVGRQVFVAHGSGRNALKIDRVPISQGFARRTPALSPDGSLIAFIHADEGPLGNVWVVPVAEGEARQLTTQESGGVMAMHPTFSPDGQYVVYSAGASSGNVQLWRVNVETGVSQALTSGGGEYKEPALSMAGDRMVYATSHSVWRLVRINPLTGERSTLLETRMPIILPDMSQDDSRIVFFTMLDSGRQLFTVNSDGSNLEQRTFDQNGTNALPSWHDDSILYYRDRSLHRLNATTGRDTQVFADFHWSSRNWLNANGDKLSYHNIDRVANTHNAVVRGFGESEEIELPVPIEGGQWSADGSELLGFHRRTGEIYICRPAVGECSRLIFNGEAVTGLEPEWSNDESQVFYRRWDESGDCCSVWRSNRDGSGTVRIAELTGFAANYSFFEVDADNAIIYNFGDRSADEIWMAQVDDTADD